MKNLLFLFLGLLPGLVSAQSIEIDTKGATVDFVFTDDDTKGTLSGVTAVITFDAKNLNTAKVVGSVKVNTISTENKRRDDHLKSSSFFDAEKFPEMTFTSSSIYQEGDKFKSKGTLKIKGVEKEVIFNLENTGSMLIFKTTIYSVDFGVTSKEDREKSKVKVTVKIPV